MDLNTIKAGDLVAQMVRGFTSNEERWSVLHTVKKVTAKRFTVAGSTVDKATGREPGRSYRTRWVLANPEMIAEYAAKNVARDVAQAKREAVHAAESRIETTTEEIVTFARALSEDKRTLPWFETARQLISKLDRDKAIAKVS